MENTPKKGAQLPSSNSNVMCDAENEVSVRVLQSPTSLQAS